MTRGLVHVVDDDAAFRGSLVFLLETIGFTVRDHPSAEAFLADGAAGGGCVIVDLAMPGLSGMDLQAALARRGIDLPLIFLTGHGDIPTSVRAMRGGAEDFLTKPVEAGDLIAAVTRALGRLDDRAVERGRLQGLRERYARLAPRQRAVFARIVSGQLNKQVAADLGITLQTVKMHRGEIMRRMEADSFADLVRMAQALGAVPCD